MTLKQCHVDMNVLSQYFTNLDTMSSIKRYKYICSLYAHSLISVFEKCPLSDDNEIYYMAGENPVS